MTRTGARGPTIVLFAVVGGALLGEWLGASEAPALPAAGALLMLGAVRWRERNGFVVAVVAFGLLSTASMQRALHGIEHSPLTSAVTHRAVVNVRGSLIDDPSGSFGAQVLLRASRYDDGRTRSRSAGGRTLLVTAGSQSASELRLLDAGDSVVLRGTLRQLDGRLRRFRWQHAVARFSASSVVSVARPTSLLLRVANRVRGWVTRGNDRLPPTERGLLAAFLLGDTRQIPKELVGSFRGAGLSHLLVVSGANVAFVLALVGPLLRRLPLGTRFAIGVFVLVVFGAMTRWEPSVLRAIAMAMLALTGMLLGRPQAGLRLLVVAVVILLLIDPFLVHSVGFLLSVGATAGIVVFAPAISPRLRGPAWLRESLSVTLAAQLGVAPVLIPVFGSMPVVALPANLLAVPAVGPLTIVGLVTGATGGIVHSVAPALVVALDTPLLVLARYVETLARWAASVPFAIDGRGAWGLLTLGSLWAAGSRVRRLRDAADR